MFPSELTRGVHRLLLLARCRAARMGNSLWTRPPDTAEGEYVRDTVASNCVVIFSKTACPYCTMAKRAFDEIGARYLAVELDRRADGRALQQALALATGARTVPQVFVNGRCIGGGTETQRLSQQGRLATLVAKCQLPGAAEAAGAER
ncbi:unnamed protein product [Lampetra planeri]